MGGVLQEEASQLLVPRADEEEKKEAQTGRDHASIGKLKETIT